MFKKDFLTGMYIIKGIESFCITLPRGKEFFDREKENLNGFISSSEELPACYNDSYTCLITTIWEIEQGEIVGEVAYCNGVRACCPVHDLGCYADKREISLFEEEHDYAHHKNECEVEAYLETIKGVFR